jgi:hypothetical protein
MEWILIKEYASEAEAEIVKGRLISNGIQARVTCDNLGGLYSGLTPVLSLAKLYVFEDSKEKALKLLEEELKEN